MLCAAHMIEIQCCWMLVVATINTTPTDFFLLNPSPLLGVDLERSLLARLFASFGGIPPCPTSTTGFGGFVTPGSGFPLFRLFVAAICLSSFCLLFLRERLTSLLTTFLLLLCSTVLALGISAISAGHPEVTGLKFLSARPLTDFCRHLRRIHLPHHTVKILIYVGRYGVWLPTFNNPMQSATCPKG